MARRRSYITLTAAVSVIALVGATQQAQAGAYAYSTTQISNFLVTSNAAINVIPNSVVAGENGSATLNSTTVPLTPDANATAQATYPGVQQACVASGTCPTSAQPFTFVTPPYVNGDFSQSAAWQSGSVLVSPGASSNTEAQTQLTGAATSSGNATNSLTAGFQFILSPAGPFASLNASFDALANLMADVVSPGGTAKASASFEIDITCAQTTCQNQDLTTSSNGQLLVDWFPTQPTEASNNVDLNSTSSSNPALTLNLSRTQPVVGGPVTYNQSGLLSLAATLPTNTVLSFNITQTSSDTASSIPEPGTLVLFGAGLLVFGVAARKRRRAV